MQNIYRKLKVLAKYILQTPSERRHSLVGPANLWEMKRDFQFNFLKNMGIRPEHYLLDLGCGTLRGGIPLIEYLISEHYFGVDVREKVLVEAQKELEDAGLSSKRPHLILSTGASELQLNQKFDFIWAFSVLIHMSDEIHNETLAFVSKHLADDGVFYANIVSYDLNEANWEEFPVVSRSLDFYKSECSKVGLAVEDIGSLGELGHVSNVESHDSQRMLKISKSDAVNNSV